jgi:hypothetical protein
MCVIVYKPVGKTISHEEIRKMWARNKDGLGFIGKKDDKSKWFFQKGIMNLDEAIEVLSDYLLEEAELVVHFRLQSRGSISREMTHPFDWGNSVEQRFLFHNGTINLLTGGTCFSDSSVLGQLIQPVDTDSAFAILGNFAKKDYGRFVAFTRRKGEEEPLIKIFDGKESLWRDGIWYSNLVHENVAKPAPYTPPNVQTQLSLPAPKSTTVKTQDDENIEKIVDFYIDKYKLQDTQITRDLVKNKLSINSMCFDFIERIVDAIETNPDTNSDPILEFFQS